MLGGVAERRAAEKDQIHIRAPASARPTPSRGSPCRSGENEGGGNGSGGGSLLPLPCRTGSLCSRRRPGPDTCEASECRWVRTWRGAPRPTPAPRARVPVGPRRQLSHAHFCGGDCGEPSSGPRVRSSSKLTSPPPAQGRISKHAALHTPRLAPGQRAVGRQGVGTHLGQQHPILRAGGWDPGRRRDPWGLDRAGRASRRGSQRLRSPSRACPAPCTNRSHIQGESSRARPLPRPRLSAPEPMARRGGRAGLGVVSPPGVIIPALGRAAAPLRFDL